MKEINITFAGVIRCSADWVIVLLPPPFTQRAVNVQTVQQKRSFIKPKLLMRRRHLFSEAEQRLARCLLE